MYQIIPITDTIKSRYPQLKDYYLCQFLGENLLSAIICSILHYLLNRRLSRSFEYFKSLRINYKQQSSQEIAKILKESVQMENPIQSFFEKLSILDWNNLMTEVFLQDFCFSYELIYQGQINLNYLADFLDLNIQIIPQFNSLGRGINNLIIIQENEEYYFIIPEPQFQLETQVICFNCSRKVYVFMQSNCNHQICWNCIKKENQMSLLSDFQCRCGTIILKQQVEQFQTEINIIAKTNHYNLLLEQFYHQQSSNVQQKRSTIHSNYLAQINESIIEQLTATEIQASILNETNRILEQIDEVCCKCNRESNKPYFYLTNCTHKLCVECISLEFSNDNCGGCYCLGCLNKISRREYEQYLQQINIEIDKIKLKPSINDKNQCYNCKKLFPFILFTIKNCKHSFCDECLEQLLLAVNYFMVFYCTVQNCNGTYKKQDYENFKQEFRKNIQIQQSELQNTCDENQLNQCKLCFKKYQIEQQSEIKDQICLNCYNSNQNSKNLIKNESTKISVDEEEEENDLDWSFFIDICQKCLKKSQYQLFQVQLCNHKFCNQCIQSSIQNKQKEQRCPYKECQSLFTKRSYQIYYNNLLQDNEILNNQNIKQNYQQLQNHQNTQQSQKQNQINLTSSSNSLTKTLSNKSNGSDDQQLCSFCNCQNQIDQIFKIKCGHQICIRCSLRLKGENFRCSKCLTLFDNLKFNQFRKSSSYKCDNCQNIFQFNQVLPNQICNHFLCFKCLQSTYQNKSIQYCSVKSCNKIFNADHITKFLLNYQEVDKNKDKNFQNQNVQFVTQQYTNTNSNSQSQNEINNQTKSINFKQIQDLQISNIQNCMNCNSDFNDFNQPIQFSCNLHIVGICCILSNYRNCIICDCK